MRAPSIKVDGTASFAHRQGDRVHVVLRPEGNETRLTPGVVRVRSTGRPIEVEARTTTEHGAPALTFDVPQKGLREEVWRLALRPEGADEFTRVQARLLARPGQPVALLTGPKPGGGRTPLIPTPRESRARQVARRLPAPVKKVVREGLAVARSRTRRS